MIRANYIINFIVLTSLMICPFQSGFAEQFKEIDLSTGWKFSPGDDLNWANPSFDDSKWIDILSNLVWESQGFEKHDGYGWYRLKVDFPLELKQAALKKGFELHIGKVNDCDQTFLNGLLIGQNGRLLHYGSEATEDFISERTSAAIERNYVIQADDERILWGQPNVIAVRVFDKGNNGGLFGSRPHIRVLELSDIIQILPDESDFAMRGSGNFYKSVIIKNTSPKYEYSGILKITVLESETQKMLLKEAENITLKPEQRQEMNFTFNSSFYKPHTVYYEFSESSFENVIISQQVPYLRTPKALPSPKINGPKIYGVRPGSPFLYRVPATGQRPMTFSCENLPEGLAIDNSTGIISGKISDQGEYETTLVARNQFGNDTRTFKIVVGNRLALTPPMGWNSWYIHYDRITDELMRQSADAMVNSGMADYGYQYVNIDDCWMVKADSEDPVLGGPQRETDGTLLANKRFPDMNAMTNYIHSKGLKAGLYISPGLRTCSGYTGSYGHERQDAETFAKWGFDFLKYDWCYYSEIAQDHSREELIKPYRQMWDELQRLDRDIVLNLCQYGMGDVWEWGGQVGNCWRTTGDLGLESASDMPGFFAIGMSNAQHWEYAQPGGWNDPDYILIGWVGNAYKMGEGEKTKLTPDEQYFYMSMWSLMAAPLIFSGDMRKLDPFTLNVLCNSEVIDVNQDPLGKQAKILRQNVNELILVKDMEDGSKVIGLFNLTKQKSSIAINWSEINVAPIQKVRNLWQQKDLGEIQTQFVEKVPPHGVVMVRVENAE